MCTKHHTRRRRQLEENSGDRGMLTWPPNSDACILFRVKSAFLLPKWWPDFSACIDVREKRRFVSNYEYVSNWRVVEGVRNSLGVTWYILCRHFSISLVFQVELYYSWLKVEEVSKVWLKRMVIVENANYKFRFNLTKFNYQCIIIGRLNRLWMMKLINNTNSKSHMWKLKPQYDSCDPSEHS